MNGELDEGRRRGGESEEGDKKQAGMRIASTRQEDGRERGGEVRASAKTEQTKGVHVMQVRTWCGLYGMVR